MTRFWPRVNAWNYLGDFQKYFFFFANFPSASPSTFFLPPFSCVEHGSDGWRSSSHLGPQGDLKGRSHRYTAQRHDECVCVVGGLAPRRGLGHRLLSYFEVCGLLPRSQDTSVWVRWLQSCVSWETVSWTQRRGRGLLHITSLCRISGCVTLGVIQLVAVFTPSRVCMFPPAARASAPRVLWDAVSMHKTDPKLPLFQNPKGKQESTVSNFGKFPPLSEYGSRKSCSTRSIRKNPEIVVCDLQLT